VSRRTLRLALPTLVLAASVTAAQPAVAAPDFEFVLPAGTACSDFDLRVVGTGGKSHTTVFENGRTITAGTGSALTFTNLSSGAEVSLRSSGAVTRTSPNPDGTTTLELTGHNVLILFPTDEPAGPSTTLVVGLVVFTVDAAGNFIVRSVSGATTDLCAALTG